MLLLPAPDAPGTCPQAEALALRSNPAINQSTIGPFCSSLCPVGTEPSVQALLQAWGTQSGTLETMNQRACTLAGEMDEQMNE